MWASFLPSGLADAADYLGAAGLIPSELGWRSAVALLIVMISIIGGKIIPSFTRNWLVKQERSRSLPTQPQVLDRLVIVSTAIAFLFWLVFPANPLTEGILLLAGIAQALRLSRWGGSQSLSDPLVLVLHLGYVWVPIGLVLLGMSVAGFGVPQSAGVHALTAGAMTTMILAVMTRASLGHTGRPLKASAITIGSYACVTAGAVLRVVASFGIGRYPLMFELAGVLWGSALVLFLIAYVPILWSPRIGDRM